MQLEVDRVFGGCSEAAQLKIGLTDRINGTVTVDRQEHSENQARRRPRQKGESGNKIVCKSEPWGRKVPLRRIRDI